MEEALNLISYRGWELGYLRGSKTTWEAQVLSKLDPPQEIKGKTYRYNVAYGAGTDPVSALDMAIESAEEGWSRLEPPSIYGGASIVEHSSLSQIIGGIKPPINRRF